MLGILSQVQYWKLSWKQLIRALERNVGQLAVDSENYLLILRSKL